MSSKPDIKPAIAPNPAAPADAAPPPPHDAMRRLQIGIAGVLTVLLLVGMAGLIGDRARERAAADPDTAAEVKVPGADQKPASAPLEELGVQPVSKDQNAATDIKAQADPNADTSGVEARYPKAKLGDFVGDPTKLTEMDALVAYLQMLGTLVDFDSYVPEQNRR